MLSGKKIKELVGRKELTISPFNQECINPNSYDVHLHDKIATYKYDNFLDSKKENELQYQPIPEEGIVLRPGKLYLGRTVEHTETPHHIPGIEGKSSLARLGVSIHVTAGFGDIGFKGYWTLEITVVTSVRLYSGMRIAQLYYDNIEGYYGLYEGKYQENKGVEGSKSYEDI